MAVVKYTVSQFSRQYDCMQSYITLYTCMSAKRLFREATICEDSCEESFYFQSSNVSVMLKLFSKLYV